MHDLFSFLFYLHFGLFPFKEIPVLLTPLSKVYLTDYVPFLIMILE